MASLIIRNRQLGRHSPPIRIIQIDDNLASADGQAVKDMLLCEVNLFYFMHVYEVEF